MPLPHCCTCEYWYRGLCRGFCCCCPPQCEYKCMKCLFDFFGFIYCFQKVLGCLLDAPLRFIKSILKWFCCAASFLLLLLALLAALLAYLFRMFCTEILNILDIIFVSGFGGIFPLMALVDAVSQTWNYVAPRANFLLDLFSGISSEMQIRLTEDLGDTGTEILLDELLENSKVLGKIFLSVLIGISMSDPSNLNALADNSANLTQAIIDNNVDLLELLLASAQSEEERQQLLEQYKEYPVFTGTLFAAASANGLPSSRKLLLEQDYGDTPKSGMSPGSEEYSFVRDHDLDNGNTTVLTRGEAIASAINILSEVYHYNVVDKLSGAEKNSSNASVLALSDLFKKGYGRGCGFGDFGCSQSVSWSRSNEEEPLLQKWIQAFLIQEIRKTRQPTYQKRELLLELLPPPLDCLLDIPVDPFCFLNLIFPLPLTPPTWLEPLIDFDCSCDAYDDTAGYYTAGGFDNFLLVIKTIFSALSSIAPVSAFITSLGTLPPFILDNFFLGAPGVLPTPEEIICAIIHADYFLAYAIPGIILAKAMFDALGSIYHCFKTCIELQILRQHADLVDRVLFAEQEARAYELLFARDGPHSMQNAHYFCYGLTKDPRTGLSTRGNIERKPHSYWTSEGARPLVYDALERIRARWSCHDSFHAKENIGATRIQPPFLISSDMGEVHEHTSEVQKRLVYMACRDSEKIDPQTVKRVYHMCHPEESLSYYMLSHGLLSDDEFMRFTGSRRTGKHLLSEMHRKEFGGLQGLIPDPSHTDYRWYSRNFKQRLRNPIKLHHNTKYFERQLDVAANVPHGSVPLDL